MVGHLEVFGPKRFAAPLQELLLPLPLRVPGQEDSPPPPLHLEDEGVGVGYPRIGPPLKGKDEKCGPAEGDPLPSLQRDDLDFPPFGLPKQAVRLGAKEIPLGEVESADSQRGHDTEDPSGVVGMEVGQEETLQGADSLQKQGGYHQELPHIRGTYIASPGVDQKLSTPGIPQEEALALPYVEKGDLRPLHPALGPEDCQNQEKVA